MRNEVLFADATSITPSLRRKNQNAKTHIATIMIAIAQVIETANKRTEKKRITNG